MKARFHTRYIFEAALAWGLFGLFRALPIDTASALGGKALRALGPHLKRHEVARRQLLVAFPEMPTEEQERTLREMWENLGRTLGEFAHVPRKAMMERIEVRGREHLEGLRALGKPMMFISGHFANWEIGPRIAAGLGMELLSVYRPANNPLTEILLRKMRGSFHAGMSGKGAGGAAQVIRAIKEGRNVGMLVDQKMNEGIPIPFFGRPAMTAPALAQLALKYGLPVLPGRVTRLRGAHFRVTILPPIYFTQSGDKEHDVRQAMTQINALLESWVRETPGQWLWLHRRWGKNI